MSKFLFEVQQHNRLAQKGLLRRFSITCYGHQESVEEMRAHKNEMFQSLKNKRGTREYEEWFLNYKPVANKGKNSEPENENTETDENVETQTIVPKSKKKKNKSKKGKSKRRTSSKVFNFKMFKTMKNRN
jgi:hypothetical protein